MWLMTSFLFCCINLFFLCFCREYPEYTRQACQNHREESCQTGDQGGQDRKSYTCKCEKWTVVVSGALHVIFSFQVFTPCRLFVFTSKIPTKIDFNIHYLDLVSIESKKLTQVSIVLHCNIKYSLLIFMLYFTADVGHPWKSLLLPHTRRTESNIRFAHHCHCDCH